MKKLVVILLLSIPALCWAQNLSTQLERIAVNAVAKSAVQVHVKLAKPVYMSDVMFRPVRGGKDTVIRIDYKEQKCTGRLAAQKTHVVVPVSCVQDEKYKATQVRLTFADGSQLKKPGKVVQVQDELAHIRL